MFSSLHEYALIPLISSLFLEKTLILNLLGRKRIFAIEMAKNLGN